jgi:RHS repeat-associated protein
VNSLNQYTAFIPPGGSQSQSFDDDGNLTGDATWSYSYDAENRLIGMSKTGQTLAFKYDYLGRRVEKTVTGTGAMDHKYIYDGWNLIAEVDASTGNITRSYTWGLDVTGTLTGAGGAGGLLEVTNFAYSGGSISSTTDYFAGHDGNGNLVALVDASGNVAQGYEYSPYGEVINRINNDAAVADSAMGFADRYTDSETGMAYYGMRYYSPVLGRFVNRDPAEEAGGINLYGFCANDPIDRNDVLGKYPAVNGAVPANMQTVGDLIAGIQAANADFNFSVQFTGLNSTYEEYGKINLKLNFSEVGNPDSKGIQNTIQLGSLTLGQASEMLSLDLNSGGSGAKQTSDLVAEAAKMKPGSYSVSEDGSLVRIGDAPNSGLGRYFDPNGQIQSDIATAGRAGNYSKVLGLAARATVSLLGEAVSKYGGDVIEAVGLMAIFGPGPAVERQVAAESGAARTIGEMLPGAHPDSMIHLTPAGAESFANGVEGGTYWARLGDVSHMTLEQYQLGVVGPDVAASLGQPVSGFVVSSPGTGSFMWEGAFNPAGVMEYTNSGLLKGASYAPIW